MQFEVEYEMFDLSKEYLGKYFLISDMKITYNTVANTNPLAFRYPNMNDNRTNQLLLF